MSLTFTLLSASIENNKDQSSRTRILAAIIAGVLGTALATSPAYPQSHASFAIKAEFGPYAVGFRLVEQYDYSRTFAPLLDELGIPFQGERARPIQTLIWYPAEKNAAQPMTVGDYVALGRTEASFGHPQAFDDPADYSTSGIRPTCPDRLKATRDAPPDSQRFAVVIYRKEAISTYQELLQKDPGNLFASTALAQLNAQVQKP